MAQSSSFSSSAFRADSSGRDTAARGEGWVVMEHRRVRGRGRARGGALTLNMTSMIDVVFLLLIYFVVATDFRTAEELYPLDLPSREGQAQADPFALDVEPLRISVSSTGMGRTMARVRLHGPYPQPANFDELHEFLRDRQVHEDNVGSGALFEPDTPIVIQPAATTRWEHAMEAFNAAAKARYSNVTFARPE